MVCAAQAADKRENSGSFYKRWCNVISPEKIAEIDAIRKEVTAKVDTIKTMESCKVTEAEKQKYRD
jgi:hypothetical protein